MAYANILTYKRCECVFINTWQHTRKTTLIYWLIVLKKSVIFFCLSILRLKDTSLLQNLKYQSMLSDSIVSPNRVLGQYLFGCVLLCNPKNDRIQTVGDYVTLLLHFTLLALWP